MKTKEEVMKERERLVRINETAPYDKEMFQNLVVQINTLDWVLEGYWNAKNS